MSLRSFYTVNDERENSVIGLQMERASESHDRERDSGSDSDSDRESDRDSVSDENEGPDNVARPIMPLTVKYDNRDH